MNRRHFCKIASIAAASIYLGRVNSFAGSKDGASVPSPCARLPKSCSIAVIRREFHPDLQATFLDDPDSGPCPVYNAGDEYHFSSGDPCPEGFCPRLWETLCNSMHREPTASCSAPLEASTYLLACPDGSRPVIVRVDIG